MDKITDKEDIRIIDQKINEVCRTEIVRYTCKKIFHSNSIARSWSSQKWKFIYKSLPCQYS